MTTSRETIREIGTIVFNRMKKVRKLMNPDVEVKLVIFIEETIASLSFIISMLSTARIRHKISWITMIITMSLFKIVSTLDVLFFAFTEFSIILDYFPE